MSNLALIRAREANFRTCQVADWLDGFPLIAGPGPASVVAGAANVGSGSCAVAGVDAGAEIGTQVVRVSGIAGGLTYLAVADLAGEATGEGVVGAPLYAAGVTLAVAQGQVPFAVGDAFAVSVLPQPVDLTGLIFTLDSRIASGSATFALRATSDPGSAGPNRILSGGPAGTLAMDVPQAAMAACPTGPTPYPHNVYATDPATGRCVTAFSGTIDHRAVLIPGG